MQKHSIFFLATIIIASSLFFLSACSKTETPQQASTTKSTTPTTKSTTPTTKSTTQQNGPITYQNKTYKYKIDVPKGWVIDTSGEDYIAIRFPDWRYDNSAEGGGSLGIQNKKITLDEFIKKYNSPPANYIIKQEPYELDGISAKKLTATTDLGIEVTYIFAEKNGVAYIISFDPEDSKLVEIFSSFSFEKN